jgi:hypothetical protein
MATRTFHQNAFSETRGFAPTCIGLGASRLEHLWVWFLSNSVKYLDCYASNGPHSHAPHGVLALFVLVYPAAAIIKLARPTTDGATSLSSLGCRLLRASTSIPPAKILLLPVRTTARIHVLQLLLLLLWYGPATSVPAFNASQRCSLSCRCLLMVLLSRDPRRAAVILLHQSPLPMVRRGYVRSNPSGSRSGHAMYLLIHDRGTARTKSLPL